MKNFSFIFLFSIMLFGNSFEKGKIKENFFEKNNTLLKLKAPTLNMIHWALTKGPKRVGDNSDKEFQIGEVADFLEDYLLEPNREKSICDLNIMKFYNTKEPLARAFTKEEFEALAYYLIEYTPPLKKEKKDSFLLKKVDEKLLLEKAKKTKRLILIEVATSDCIYCRKMEKEVLAQSDIQELLSKHFILLKIDPTKQELPFDTKRAYVNITPSFFILDEHANAVDMIVGYNPKNQFKKKLSTRPKYITYFNDKKRVQIQGRFLQD